MRVEDSGTQGDSAAGESGPPATDGQTRWWDRDHPLLLEPPGAGQAVREGGGHSQRSPATLRSPAAS